MGRPPRTTLYVLFAVFVLLAILSVLIGTPLAIVLWLAMLAIVVYFGFIAATEWKGGREQEQESNTDEEDAE